MSRRTKILLGVTVALVAWFAVTLRWATQPLSDSIPVGKDADNKVIVEKVQCGTLFDSDAMGGKPIPTVVTPPKITPEWELSRVPCILVHDQAQVLFGINIVVFLLGAAAIVVVTTRTHQPSIPQMSAAAA